MSVCLVKKIQENMCVTHTLPVSYRYDCRQTHVLCYCVAGWLMSPDLVSRPVSVSELISRQHLPCVSNLSWSTTQQRAWEKEAELSLLGHEALPRVSLLLIGCLREGQSGEWRLTDAGGSIRCEVSVMPSGSLGHYRKSVSQITQKMTNFAKIINFGG